MNVNKLKAKCVEKGTNISELSKKVGIACGTFYRKLNEDTFAVDEARKIAEELELSHEDVMDIFFNKTVSETRIL